MAKMEAEAAAEAAAAEVAEAEVAEAEVAEAPRASRSSAKEPNRCLVPRRLGLFRLFNRAL